MIDAALKSGYASGNGLRWRIVSGGLGVGKAQP